MKNHALNKTREGITVFPANLLETIVFNESGEMIGVAHSGRKMFYSYGNNGDFNIMSYCFPGYKGIKRPVIEITISNWNNTLWE